MEAWKFRLVLCIVLIFLMIGDFLGFGHIKGYNLMPGQKSQFNQQENQAEINVNEGRTFNELSSPEDSVDERRKNAKERLSAAIRESCLPKMLCEMAAKLENDLSSKEKDLLYLLRSTTMTLAATSASKWHFAAHMGELLRYTGDFNSGPMGCANLWPQCPISSKKLMSLSYNVNLK